MKIHVDCRHYRGDVPCRPHKLHGVHCQDCPHHDPVKGRILILKLGAIGDVIRTTPILRKLKEEFPRAEIHWLTHTPEVLPSMVDRAFRFIPEHIEILKKTSYDLLLNLDKDRETCALSLGIRAKKKMGFTLRAGKCHPLNHAAEDKWMTGLFDDFNKSNHKSYPREIFEMCGYSFNREEYVLEARGNSKLKIPKDRPIVGLNTGCGIRWTTRLWPEKHWIQLAKTLTKNGYTVILLGGEQEHEKNRKIAQLTKARYLGHFSLPVFIDLIDNCDIVVTSVTMALHLAIGLKKKIVLFNNIFNPNEFELYGRGVILEPGKPCQCCFRNECSHPCMELIKPERVLSAVQAFDAGQ
jgi:ADP-heptose:LPS heptosyltransferase